jgi:hypothetical protein
MKKMFVDESLNEFAKKRGRPRKIKEIDPEQERDDWYEASDEDEFDADEVGPEQIEDIELEDEVTDIALVKKITKTLDNELQIPEFSRGILKFKVRSTGENIKGSPMAKMSGGEAYLFKTQNGMKKIRVDDMIVESFKGPVKYVSESLKDYEI